MKPTETIPEDFVLDLLTNEQLWVLSDRLMERAFSLIRRGCEVQAECRRRTKAFLHAERTAQAANRKSAIGNRKSAGGAR